jgi:hypothetical protein
MESKDWEAAANHIFCIEELRELFSGGNVLFNSPFDRVFRWMRYGCAMLRAWELKNALVLFRMSDLERDGRRLDGDDLHDIKDPGIFMQAASDRVRRCLGVMVTSSRKLLVVDECYELNDLMQELILKNIARRFPDFDLEKNRIKDRLKRIDSSTVESTKSADVSNLRDEVSLGNTLTDSLGHTDHHATEAEGQELLDLSRFDREAPSIDELNMKLVADGFIPTVEIVVEEDDDTIEVLKRLSLD